jgi:hypothetical protein
MAQQLLTRTIIGRKGMHIKNEKGQRVYAAPGKTIKVTPAQAENFADRLVDPKVVQAQQAAADAQAKAQQEAQKQQEPEQAKQEQPKQEQEQPKQGQ